MPARRKSRAVVPTGYYVSEILPSGRQIIGHDTEPNFRCELAPGQFAELVGLSEFDQRQKMQQFLLAAHLATTT